MDKAIVGSWLVRRIRNAAVGDAAQLAGTPSHPGATPGTAIVLPKIADAFHGVVAEHAHIAANFPTWHTEYQTRVMQNGRQYDLLGMIKPDSTHVMVYFDITDWLGK